MQETRVGRIIEMVTSKKKRWTFTLEPGRGETYASCKATLYGHSTYERGSVLAGRPQRVFVEQWSSWDEARQELEQVKKACRSFKYDDFGEGGGSTHVPVAVVTAGLPDDEG